MVLIAWPQTNTGSVIQPEPPCLRLLGRHLQPLTSPQPFDPTIADLPPRIPEQNGNPPIAVTAILPSKLDHIGHQPVFVSSSAWPISLRGSMLAQHAANPSLGHTELSENLINAGTATLNARERSRAQKFRHFL